MTSSQVAGFPGLGSVQAVKEPLPQTNCKLQAVVPPPLPSPSLSSHFCLMCNHPSGSGTLLSRCLRHAGDRPCRGAPVFERAPKSGMESLTSGGSQQQSCFMSPVDLPLDHERRPPDDPEIALLLHSHHPRHDDMPGVALAAASVACTSLPRCDPSLQIALAVHI